jgi:hypothetical protein
MVPAVSMSREAEAGTTTAPFVPSKLIPRPTLPAVARVTPEPCAAPWLPLPEESQTGPLASSNLYHAASPGCGCPAGHWPELEDEPALDDEAPVDDEEAPVLADAALDDDAAPVPLDTTALPLLEPPVAAVEAGAPPAPPVPAAHAAGSSARAATAMRSIRLRVTAGAIEQMVAQPRAAVEREAGGDREATSASPIHHVAAWARDVTAKSCDHACAPLTTLP